MDPAMRILGLGTHILDCPRVRDLIARHAERFLEEVFTPNEAAYCRDRSHSTEYYAAFWATKEAVFRALGLKWKRGLNWRDVEVICERAIEPRVRVTGLLARRQQERRVTQFHATFSYSRYFATATVIAIG